LTGILQQIKQLASTADPAIENSGSRRDEDAWLETTLEAVKKCAKDLKPFSEKLRRLRPENADGKWTKMVVQTVKLFLHDTTLATIRDIVYAQVRVFFIELATHLTNRNQRHRC
jgi:hypothetical protein